MSESFALAGTPGSAGGIYTAPVGSTAPVDAKTALDAAFVGPLMVGEDGVTITIEKENAAWKKWGGVTVRKITIEGAVRYVVPIIDSSLEALRFIFGAKNVEVLTGGTIRVKRNLIDPPERAVSFDMLDGDVDIREFVPRAQPTLSGDIVFNPENPITYELELEALDPGDGDLAFFYIDRPTAG